MNVPEKDFTFFLHSKEILNVPHNTMTGSFKSFHGHVSNLDQITF